MQIGILGTGAAGRTLAEGFTRVGHEVTLGTRDPVATAARDDFADWSVENPTIGLAEFSDAAEADLVVNAGKGAASLAMVEAAGPENLAGKVLVDIANPLDFSHGFPPTLTVKDTDSLAEQIQRLAPGAKVVKTFNTVNAAVMVDPQRVGGGDTTIFVAGNDEAAKSTVSDLLREFGWRDIIDLGDLTSARGMEMWMPLWLRLMGALGTAEFNLKVVR